MVLRDDREAAFILVDTVDDIEKISVPVEKIHRILIVQDKANPNKPVQTSLRNRYTQKHICFGFLQLDFAKSLPGAVGRDVIVIEKSIYNDPLEIGRVLRTLIGTVNKDPSGTGTQATA